MNRILSKLLVTTLVTAIVLSAMPMIIMKGNAVPSTGFWILPDQSFISAPVGTNFTEIVYAGIAAGQNAFTWQVNVTFDPTLLQVTAAKYTGSGNHHSAWLDPHGPTSVAPVINNVVGTVVAGETLLAPDFEPGPSSGSLIYINFTIIKAPGVGETLTCKINPHLPGTYILDPTLATLTSTFQYATYTNAYQRPSAQPSLEMVNATHDTTYDSFSHWVNTSFNEQIYIDNLDGGWFLNNITVEWNYNSALLTVTNVIFDPLWTTHSYTTVPAGNLTLEVDDPTSTPSGKVLIATVTCQIILQGINPPQTLPDSSPRLLLDLSAYSNYTSIGLITFGSQTGNTNPTLVYPYQAAPPPYLSVSSIEQIGPGPSVGTLFNITVSLNQVVEGIYHLIGVQFRLAYNSTLVQPVAVSEGPFLPYWATQEMLAGFPPNTYPPGTFFTSFIVDPDGIYGPHVIVGDMVFPNMTGRWNEPLPNGTGVITTITFKVLAPAQSFGEPENCFNLTIVDQKAIGLDNLVDQNLVEVPLGTPINGSVCVCTNWPGRVLDLYGGAVNSGLIQLDTQHIPQFVPPYGGQGPNMPMDLVEPQSWVYLNANVTYNYWPVQHKLVAFEVDEPDGTVYTKLFAFTDDFGVAMTGFRMPWPCVDPESLFGNDTESAFWHVTATVELADVIINDTMAYHYDYLAHIFKATTDAFQYNHGGCVGVTFSYGSLAAQTYPALFLVRVVDNLGVTIGWQIVQTTIGNAWANNNTEAYKNYTAYVNVPIPKWAYAGIANVYIDAFNVEPAEGGVAITPEFGPIPIAIQPY